MNDRLAGLLDHYSLRARVFFQGRVCANERFSGADQLGYLHVVHRGRLQVRSSVHATQVIDEPSLLFYPRAAAHDVTVDPNDGVDLVCATVDIGANQGNPLALALPPMLCVPLADMPTLSAILELLFAEAFSEHCGRQAALDRLCELLLIHLLRHTLNQPAAPIGLLAGLADRRLAKALVAMHEQPARDWSLSELAAQAGMSRARFAANFRQTVGTTPGHYLTGWRINLARRFLKQGKPVAHVAQDVGYNSTTAFSRAFRAHTGTSPRQWLRSEMAEVENISLATPATGNA